MTPSVKNFNYNKTRSIYFLRSDNERHYKSERKYLSYNLIVEATPRHFAWRQRQRGKKVDANHPTKCRNSWPDLLNVMQRHYKVLNNKVGGAIERMTCL